MPSSLTVLSLVERGWQAARTLSLEVQSDRIRVVHVIKGWLSREVRAMIHPTPAIRILAIPRAWFWVGAMVSVAALMCRGRLRTIVVDNERSFRRVRRWTRCARFARFARVSVTFIQPRPDGYALSVDAQELPTAAWCEALTRS